MNKYLLTILLLGCICISAYSSDPAREGMLTADSLPSAWVYNPVYSQPLPTDDAWWLSFGDSTLNRLVNMAEAHNYDVAMAMRRIQIARKALDETRAAYYPDLAVSAGWVKGRSSGAESSPAGKASGYSYFSLGLNMSWEVDIFGRVTAQAKAKKAAINVSRADYTGTMVTVAANVAKAYFNLRLYQMQRKVAYDHLYEQEKIVNMTQTRFECGLASKLDVTQARISASATRASLPQIEALIDASCNTLAILTGEIPSDMRETLLAVPADLPTLDYSIAMGVPADLLRRRPDIVAAEAEVAEYAALLGVAKKDFLPSLTINGSIGTSAHNAGDLFSSPSLTYEIAPTLSWTIFDGLARNAQTAEARLQLENAIDNYNLTVLTALQEVDTYTSQLTTTLHAIELDSDVVDECENALTLSVDLYKQGLTDFSNVADAEMSYLTYVNELLSAKAQALATAVSIYEALGGGYGLDK